MMISSILKEKHLTKNKKLNKIKSAEGERNIEPLHNISKDYENSPVKSKGKNKKSIHSKIKKEPFESEITSSENLEKTNNKQLKRPKDETGLKLEVLEEDGHDHEESEVTLPKKKKKKLSMYPAFQVKSETLDDDSIIISPKKKKKLCPSNEEYKPGMLSNMLQNKKYGQLILPWDPSFGLDAKYESPALNEEKPKLKINPLFDLSKRQKGTSDSANQTETTIFVGNLPSNTTVSQLRSLFKCCGSVRQFKIKRNKSYTKGNSDGSNQTETAFAYLTLNSTKAAETALDLNGGLFRGHHIRVTLKGDDSQANKDTSVFVGSINYAAQDDDLWKTFEGCGEIDSVRLIRDSRTGRGKGYGYVNFKSADSVEAALKLDGSKLLDRTIRVSRHDSKVRSLSNQARVSKHKLKNKKRNAQNPTTKPSASPTVSKKKKSRQDIEVKPDIVSDSTSTKEKKKKKKTHKVEEAET